MNMRDNNSMGYMVRTIVFFAIIIYVLTSCLAFGAEIRISPDTIPTHAINGTITFDITVSDVDSLFAFGCDLSFDPQFLQVTEVLEDTFLCCSGADSVPTALTYSIEQNKVVIGLTQLNPSSGGGSTVTAVPIASVRAKIVSYGTSALTLSSTYLLKPDGVSQIPHTVHNGVVSATYAPSSTTVLFEPSDTNVFTTQSFTIFLSVDDVEGLFGFSADILYPKGIVKIDSVKEGPFLSVYGSRLTYFASDLDTTEGKLLVGGTILSSSDTGVTTEEPMPIAYIYCTALQYADTNISIEQVTLLAPDGSTPYPIANIGKCNLQILPATRLVFQPNTGSGKDSYVSQSQPSQNYGADSMLLVTSGSNKAFSLVQFSLDGITKQAAIGAAKLMLYGKPSSNPDTIGVRPILSDWDEFSVSWNSLPDTEAVVDLGFLNIAGWWNWDIKDLRPEVDQWKI